MGGYAVGAGLVALATAVALPVFGRGYPTDAAMLYLLAVVVASLTLARGPSLLTALLSVLAFDFVFIPPYHTLNVSDPHHWITFAAMLLVGVVTGHLTRRVREAERERLRNALLSSVSHDLRTPLGVIEGAASTLLDEGASLDAATRRDLAQSIREEAERLGRRVRDLLDMTRLEGGAVALDVEWQSVEELVGAALFSAERSGGAGRVRVALPPEPPLLPCDGMLVEQVLVNLLENALKYSAPDTAVEVSAEERKAEVVLSVADRGPGVPAGEEERIFEKFYRARARRDADGVGLGLAICRSIVAAHGGRIWAEARPGGGAVFRVALPRKDPPPRAPAEEESP